MTDQFLSVLVNLTVLVLLPMSTYYLVQRIRHGLTFSEVCRRTGLVVGDPRYIRYCAIAALAVVTGVLLFPPSIADSTAEGSAFAAFDGLGLTGRSILLAALYGIVKTGFAEEFLFRGMIAGSLARRMSSLTANIVQSMIFLAPHLLILVVAPKMWPVLIVVFAGAMFTGWIRIKSGSIIGPWLLHAAANVTMALSVAARSVV